MAGAEDVEQLAAVGYRVIRDVGHGGFGTVYLAEQVSVGREVAVKLLQEIPDEWSGVRFNRECQALGRLSWHPHIVVVYDAGVTPGGLPYLSMEYLDGGNLAEAVRAAGGGLPWEDVASIGVQLSGALAAAHANGVLHRDVKPGNVLLGNFGEAKLTDFGIARLADSEVTRSTGDFTGTVAYTAPEVLNGDEPSEQSDLYSLAAMMFAVLTGRPAFATQQKSSPLALLGRVLNDPVPDLRPHGVPGPLCDAIEAAMRKDPADRPTSGGVFGAILQDAQRALGVAEDRLIVARSDARPAREKDRSASRDPDPDRTVPRERPPSSDPAQPAKKSNAKKATAKKATATKTAAAKAPKKANADMSLTPQAVQRRTPKPAAAKRAPSSAKKNLPVASAEPIAAPPAPTDMRPQVVHRSTKKLPALLLLVATVAAAIGIGSFAGLRTRQDSDDGGPLSATTTIATSTTSAVPFVLPSGAGDTYFVARIKRGDTLTIRSTPELRDDNIVFDAPGGTAGIRVTGQAARSGNIEWLPVATSDGRSGWASSRFLDSSKGFSTKADASSMIQGLGYRITGDDIWQPSELSGIVATRSDGVITFFFANGVYVGNDRSDTTHKSAAIVRINGGRATLAYDDKPQQFTFLLDRVPIRAE